MRLRQTRGNRANDKGDGAPKRARRETVFACGPRFGHLARGASVATHFGRHRQQDFTWVQGFRKWASFQKFFW